MRTLLGLLLAILSLHAVPLERLVDRALANHPGLEALKERVAIADAAAARAGNFDDPGLGLFMNDIRFDDPTNRSLEPMQTQGVTLTQKFPWLGKRDAREALARTRVRLADATLEEAAVELARRIEEGAWRLWSLQKRLQLVEKTLRLTEQNIDLYESYTAAHDAADAHMGLMQAHLTRSRLLARAERLKGETDATADLLGYLSFTGAPVRDVSMPRRDPDDTKSLEKSPRVRIARIDAERAERRLALEKLSLDVDPIVTIAYAHRTTYEDYLSVAVGFSLPIYGTQQSRIEEARHEALARRSTLQDVHERVRSRLSALEAQAESQRRILEILRQKSLPEIEHMFDLAASDIAAGGDLYRFVDLLEQKLRLEILAVEAEAAYRQLRARIRALKGIR